jgi:predicted enzyme related to lactoylglutathione lyase
MSAQINHVAIVSDNYAQLAKFYEAVFGMKSSELQRSASAVTVGDGYVGLNINPRRAGRSAGLDHFGIQVDDVETVFERMRKNYPSVKWLKRPSNRPFAGITTHDPDGNVFDLSQKDMSNRAAIYVENDGKANRRHIDHVAVRTMHPTEMAQFYRDVFELTPKNKTPGDPNHYLTDGHDHPGHGSHRLQGRKRGGAQGGRGAHRRKQPAAGAGADDRARGPKA